MRDYIHGIQNGIHVFDLFKTEAKLEEVKAILTALAENGKEILIVGTKVQARDLVKELAIATNHHYVIDKWVPGLLTNFATLKKRIATFNKIEKDIET
jgi:small subunit ribosomal protein S2